MNLRNALLALALAAALPFASVHAEPFTFQGFLEQAGTPLNGSANLAFKLYDADTAGSQIGTTLTANAWPVAAGVFSIDLDFTGVVFTGAQRWLQVEVNGTPLAGRIAVQPAPLAASANALRGFNVLGSTPSSGQVLKWNGTAWAPAAESGGSSYSAGNGLTLSGTTFSVNFAGSGAADTVSRSDHGHYGATWSGNSATKGLRVSNSSTSGIGIEGIAMGTGPDAYGVLGESTNPTGAGVVGYASAQSGVNSGVRGQSLSESGTGVYGAGQAAGVRGFALGPTGRGVYGFATAASGENYGVYGRSESPDGHGVSGDAAATTGNTVGVEGMASSTSGIGVRGHAGATTGSTTGVLGTSASTSGIGVRGEATASSGVSYGVWGQSPSPTGRGVLGYATATSGVNFGVYGRSDSPDGSGVLGWNTAVSGSTAYGVWGEAASNQARAVFGDATAAAGPATGIYGRAASTTGTGVRGEASAATGNTVGIRGSAASTTGTGVLGDALATSGSNIGVLARTASGEGAGLRAENTATSGAGNGHALEVIGNLPSGDTMSVQANGTGSAWAIRATSAGSQVINAELTSTTTSGSTISAIANTVTGRAGYFQNAVGQAAQFVGSVDVSGTLSKGGGSFKIDHPLDPANRFLLHSFVESPDMMNVYNGNIVTDARGYATIELPEWFEALNRDFRYQLTVIGTFAQAIVSKKVEHNRFEIRSSQPGVEVSWQVTGIRRDAWAEKHRIPVEVQKAPAERGKYLHPELYGAPAGKRIGVPPSGK